MFLTLSPKIAGGNIQTMVEGTGFDFDSLVELELLNFQTVASEVFLHYRVIKKQILTKDLVLHLSFDKDIGKVAKDLSKFGNHAEFNTIYERGN